jgi:hypothetical protein
MNSFKIFAVGCMAIAGISSCRKKERDNPIVSPAADTSVSRPVYNFLPLDAGNYWIYQTFSIYAGDSASGINEFDSCYITTDTVMPGYATLVKQTFGNQEILFLKQEGNNLVDHKGKVHFSIDYTSIFYQGWFISPVHGPEDTVAYVKHYMGERNRITTVPAGTIHTTSFIEEYNMRPLYANYGKTRCYYHRYANGIGLISETTAFYVQSPIVHERRLVRYKVNRRN